MSSKLIKTLGTRIGGLALAGSMAWAGMSYAEDSHEEKVEEVINLVKKYDGNSNGASYFVEGGADISRNVGSLAISLDYTGGKCVLSIMPNADVDENYSYLTDEGCDGDVDSASVRSKGNSTFPVIIDGRVQRDYESVVSKLVEKLR